MLVLIIRVHKLLLLLNGVLYHPVTAYIYIYILIYHFAPSTAGINTMSFFLRSYKGITYIYIP